MCKPIEHLRGTTMVAQGRLPFQYDEAVSTESVTALAGLPPFFELMELAKLRELVASHLGERAGGQGWTHAQMVAQLAMLHISGGECVDDLDRLEADQGLCRLLREVEWHGLPRRERRKLHRRWRKRRERTIASASACRGWLGEFHSEAEESHSIRFHGTH